LRAGGSSSSSSCGPECVFTSELARLVLDDDDDFDVDGGGAASAAWPKSRTSKLSEAVAPAAATAAAAAAAAVPLPLPPTPKTRVGLLPGTPGSCRKTRWVCTPVRRTKMALGYPTWETTFVTITCCLFTAPPVRATHSLTHLLDSSWSVGR
jgi:hypothetical protein